MLEHKSSNISETR